MPDQGLRRKNRRRVRTKLGSSAQFAAAVRATGGKSDFDVVYLDNSLATQLKNEKLLEPIDRARLANAKEVAPSAFDGDAPYYVSFMTGSTVIVYDTTQVKTPPRSWNDLADPAYAGKLAIGDISGTAGSQFLLALNRMRGGTLDNLDPGFAAIAPLAKASALLYTQADQIVSLFERKEIAVAVWYSDRAGSAIDSGLPLAVVYPEEGAVGILPSVAIPKAASSPNWPRNTSTRCCPRTYRPASPRKKIRGAGQHRGPAVGEGVAHRGGGQAFRRAVAARSGGGGTRHAHLGGPLAARGRALRRRNTGHHHACIDTGAPGKAL